LHIKILVTGGSGFIGTNIIQFYLDKNIEILSLDICKPRKKSHESCFKRLDICDKNKLARCICEFSPTHVIHLAARTDLDGTKLSDYSANIVGVKNLIEGINQSGKVIKSLFASSMLVCEVGYQPVDYNDYKTSTVYGESKVLTEKIIKEYSSIRSEWNIIRPTSIWGPWFRVPYRNFFDLLISRRYINLKKNGAIKTFGYVGNSVYQIDRLLFSENPLLNHKTFYIGDNPPVSISKWANEILSVLGRKPAAEVPFYFFKVLALLGDFGGKIGVKFPMNSFRLNNMTTNNIQKLDDLYLAIGKPPYSRMDGTIQTLNWIKRQHN